MTLIIEFPSHKKYAYFDVGKQVVNQMLSASSSGEFFSRNIRNAYRFEEWTDAMLEKTLARLSLQRSAPAITLRGFLERFPGVDAVW
jgi:hypothetical protein